MAYESQYDQKVNDLYDQISNRENFTYNASDDQLYQQYVDRYQQQGRKAMMDTIGQGAALTGGYNNSYAQNVGQQTYDEYLQGLNDKLMETYQLAYQQYQDKGEDMYNLFNAAGTLANSDFERYMQEAQLQLQREQFEWQKAQAAASGGGGGGGGRGGGSGSKTGDSTTTGTTGYNLDDLLAASASGQSAESMMADLVNQGAVSNYAAAMADIAWARGK